MRASGLSLLAAVLAAGCTREAVGECPALGPGDLVITEFRGSQKPEDTLGVWVEVYNTTGAPIDLEGIKVRFRRVNGSTEVPIIVRRPVSVAADGYAVLGLVPDDDSRPPHIDYGFAGDFRQSFLAAAAVDVEACGERIDRARYENLPQTGTYSYGGPLNVDDNDVLTNWCTNPMSAGTPQQANPACP